MTLLKETIYLYTVVRIDRIEQDNVLTYGKVALRCEDFCLYHYKKEFFYVIQDDGEIFAYYTDKPQMFVPGDFSNYLNKTFYRLGVMPL